MTQPAVNISEQDGALGVLPPSAGKLFALVGPSTIGAVNTPATFARVVDVVAARGQGPVVEAACHYIDRYGKPVIVVGTAASVAGTVGSVTSLNAAGGAASGTSVVTVTASPTPNDDYDIKVKIVTGGTRGTAGITYQESLDDGRNYGPVKALGTGTSIAITGAGGVSFDLAAGTLVAGDTHAARSTAPNWNTSELGAALDALGASVATWGSVHIVGPIDASAFDTIETKLAGMHAAGKYHDWIGNARMPNAAESEATYLSSLGTAFASKSTKLGALCAGACKMSSGVNSRKYRRPISHAVAARSASVSEEINIADVNLGALAVSIRDVNGNPDEHDESINPGLDDARFLTLRTWDGYQGVYVNRPRLFSPDGSDFQLIPHRRVINLAHAALRIYFIRRTNKPILVSKTTGFILESEAVDIEVGALAILRGELLTKPKASAVAFALNRNDNVLSNKTLKGQARIVPLAYPEFINLDVGYVNPALQIIAV